MNSLRLRTKGQETDSTDGETGILVSYRELKGNEQVEASGPPPIPL
jgi:hypothetical protein